MKLYLKKKNEAKGTQLVASTIKHIQAVLITLLNKTITQVMAQNKRPGAQEKIIEQLQCYYIIYVYLYVKQNNYWK
jgi:hypothetical protein